MQLGTCKGGKGAGGMRNRGALVAINSTTGRKVTAWIMIIVVLGRAEANVHSQEFLTQSACEAGLQRTISVIESKPNWLKVDGFCTKKSG